MFSLNLLPSFGQGLVHDALSGLNCKTLLTGCSINWYDSEGIGRYYCGICLA